MVVNLLQRDEKSPNSDSCARRTGGSGCVAFPSMKAPKLNVLKIGAISVKADSYRRDFILLEVTALCQNQSYYKEDWELTKFTFCVAGSKVSLCMPAQPMF